MGDWHLMSPHNITPESHIKVMRIKEVITNQKLFIVKLILLISTLGNVKRRVWRLHFNFRVLRVNFRQHSKKNLWFGFNGV